MISVGSRTTSAKSCARHARVVLAAKSLSPTIQRQISTIETLLKTAQAAQDKNRPPL